MKILDLNLETRKYDIEVIETIHSLVILTKNGDRFYLRESDEGQLEIVAVENLIAVRPLSASAIVLESFKEVCPGTTP